MDGASSSTDLKLKVVQWMSLMCISTWLNARHFSYKLCILYTSIFSPSKFYAIQYTMHVSLYPLYQEVIIEFIIIPIHYTNLYYKLLIIPIVLLYCCNGLPLSSHHTFSVSIAQRIAGVNTCSSALEVLLSSSL